MPNFKNVDLIEIVECYAIENNLISSEEELSECFDAEVAEHVIKQYGKDDIVAMNEEFSNWADSLCKEGEIHEEQYNAYEYVGKYSD